MEWNKIEKEWKEKLSNRKISPSDLVWEKIFQELEKQDSKAKKRHYKKWFSLVACLLIGSFIIIKMLKQEVVLKIDTQKNTQQSIFPERVIVDNEKVTREQQSESSLPEPKKNITMSSKKEPYIKPQDKRVPSLYIEERAIAKVTEVEVSEIESNSKLEIDKVPVKFKTSTRVVIASGLLLNQVESEIETEYRETKITKIFEAAKRVVVYISESNYEESN